MKLKYRFLKIGISLVLLILMLNFSIDRFENASINDFKVKILEEDHKGFINHDNILASFAELYPQKHQTQIKKISVKKLEQELQKNPFTDSVNVYLDQNKNLNFYISQKNPVVRVNNGSEVFYLTEQAEKIPISKQFSMPTLMVEGKIKKEEYHSLIELYERINEDKLLKKHIVGVKKRNDNSFILLVNVDSFIVELGDLQNLEDKFKNLKAFYQQYLNHVGWNQYNKISVKYSNQIVASKK